MQNDGQVTGTFSAWDDSRAVTTTSTALSNGKIMETKTGIAFKRFSSITLPLIPSLPLTLSRPSHSFLHSHSFSDIAADSEVDLQMGVLLSDEVEPLSSIRTSHKIRGTHHPSSLPFA
jgi:hypothetical protein